MNKNELDHFLDNPDHLPEDPAAREAALLMRALSEDSGNSPDQGYWNHFNARLQARLEAKQRKPWFLRLPVWMGALATAAILIAVLSVNNTPGRSDQTLTLASLSDADLDLVSAFYNYGDEEEPGLNLADADLDLLLDTVGGDAWDTDPLLDVDPDQLESIWKEG